jgi:hypothetical protein
VVLLAEHPQALSQGQPQSAARHAHVVLDLEDTTFTIDHLPDDKLGAAER